MIAIDSTQLIHLSKIGRLYSDRAAGSAWMGVGGELERTVEYFEKLYVRVS